MSQVIDVWIIQNSRAAEVYTYAFSWCVHAYILYWRHKACAVINYHDVALLIYRKTDTVIIFDKITCIQLTPI